MAKYYVSNEANNGYIVGDDTNDGLTKQTAWLTANKALTDGVASGNKITFNDGVYDYSLNDGLVEASLENLEIDFESEYKTTINWIGSSAVGINVLADGLIENNLYVGKCYFTYSGTGFDTPIKVEQPFGKRDFSMNVKLGVRHVQFKSAQPLINFRIGKGGINIFDGGLCGEDGGMLDLGTQTIGNIAEMVRLDGAEILDINVSKFLLNVRGNTTSNSGPFAFEWTVSPLAGSFYVGGLTGKIVTNTNSGMNVVLASNAVDGATCGSSSALDVVSENPAAFVSPFSIDCKSSLEGGSAKTDNARIINNKAIRLFIDNGFACRMGTEAQNSTMANSQILGNEFDIFPQDPTTAGVHGITHTQIPTGGGLREGNIVNGAAIASLTKRSNAISRKNTYSRTTQRVLYAKDGQIGAKFENEIVVLDDNGLDVQVEVSGNHNDLTAGTCEFKDTMVISTKPISMSANAQLQSFGTSTDASTGYSERMVVSSNVDTTLPETTGIGLFNHQSDYIADVESYNESIYDPKVTVIESQKIDLKVKGITEITGNLKYELLDSKYALVFKGDGLSLNASGEASINVEGLGFNVGDTIYYRISDHNFETNAVSNIGAGKAAVEAG